MSEEMAQEPTQEAPTPSSEIAAKSAASGDFTIPEEYVGKDWAKDIKGPDDLWKLTENAQSLIGKRPAGIPANDAPEEEWQKFYNTLGRPEEPTAYEFSEIDNLPEGVDLEQHTQKFAELAHKHGLTQKQADAIRQDWLGYEMSNLAGSKEALDAKFEEVKKSFGDDFDDMQAKAVKFIEGKLPEELDGHLRAVMTNDPVAQAAFVGLVKEMQGEIDGLKSKYGQEDSLSGGQATSGRSLDDIRSELGKLNTSEANRSFDHPEHTETRKKIEALRSELSRAMK